MSDLHKESIALINRWQAWGKEAEATIKTLESKLKASRGIIQLVANQEYWDGRMWIGDCNLQAHAEDIKRVIEALGGSGCTSSTGQTQDELLFATIKTLEARIKLLEQYADHLEDCPARVFAIKPECFGKCECGLEEMKEGR